MNTSHKTVGIEVDDRESASPVLATLRECADFHVTVARLPLGDYRVDGRFLFERKTRRCATEPCLVRFADPLRPATLEGTVRTGATSAGSLQGV